MSGWVHSVHACIRIAMQWVTLRQSHLALRLLHADWAYEDGEKIWNYPAVKIHQISEGVRETKRWERYSRYFHCMTRFDDNETLSIYPGVSWIYTLHHSFPLGYPCISVHTSELLDDILGGRDRSSLDMHLQAKMESPQRCSWRTCLIENRDALGGHDQASLEMHLEAEIEWTRTMHLEAMIHRVWRRTLKMWMSQTRDALDGYDQAGMDKDMQTLDLEGGAMAADTVFIH